jgi:hypothetical protein
MKRSELKDVLDEQRYFMISLNIDLYKMGVIPSRSQIIENFLVQIWNITEQIGDSFDLDLNSIQDIEKVKLETLAKKHMISMEIDENTKIN